MDEEFAVILSQLKAQIIYDKLTLDTKLTRYGSLYENEHHHRYQYETGVFTSRVMLQLNEAILTLTQMYQNSQNQQQPQESNSNDHKLAYYEDLHGMVMLLNLAFFIDKLDDLRTFLIQLKDKLPPSSRFNRHLESICHPVKSSLLSKNIYLSFQASLFSIASIQSFHQTLYRVHALLTYIQHEPAFANSDKLTFWIHVLQVYFIQIQSKVEYARTDIVKVIHKLKRNKESLDTFVQTWKKKKGEKCTCGSCACELYFCADRYFVQPFVKLFFTIDRKSTGR